MRIDNTKCMLLFTGTLQNESEFIAVEYLPHSVCLNHWFIPKCTSNLVNEPANILCLFSFTCLLYNYPSINPIEKLTHIVCFLFTGTLQNDPKTISVKYIPHSACLNHLSNTRGTPHEENSLLLLTCLLHIDNLIII